MKSRLVDNRFSSDGFIDYTGPVIKLNQLSPEEIYLLLERLCELHSFYYSYKCELGEQELSTFLNSVLSRLGADQLLTPREVTRDFLGLLNILYQNPDVSFSQLINDEKFQVKNAKNNPEATDDFIDDIFAEFDI